MTDLVNTLLTVPEIALRLQVKPSWVYANADRLGGFRLGKYLRFSWPRVLKRLEEGASPLGSQTNDPLQGVDNE